MKRYSPNPVFTRDLIVWYQQNQRKLPWRLTKDPYKIWLSEIILQQTRVAQGLPYFERFVETFPTVQDLARAPLQQVLRLWQGLGYYSRARNLHNCALEVVQRYQGTFPSRYKDLIQLPGIGDYTASAIASFAFDLPEPVVDGNVFRVMSRVFGITLDISLASTRKEFKKLGSQLIDKHQPDVYNQAIMEFGALHCTPKQPKCATCIFADFCYAQTEHQQGMLPVKQKKPSVRNRYFNYYLIRYQNRILMKERLKKDIWKGLYDFLLLEDLSAQPPLDCLERKLPHDALMNAIEVQEPSALYKHKLSHQHIHARFLELQLQNEKDFEAWGRAFSLMDFDLQEVHLLPKPILIDNYLKAAIF